MSHLNTESFDHVLPQFNFAKPVEDTEKPTCEHTNDIKVDRLFSLNKYIDHGDIDLDNIKSTDKALHEKINTLLEDVRKEGENEEERTKQLSNRMENESVRMESPGGDIVLEEVEKEEKEREKEAANLRKEIDLLQEQVWQLNLLFKFILKRFD